MANFTTAAKVRQALTAAEVTALTADDADIIAAGILWGTYQMWSNMSARYASVAALNPTNYVSDSYPMVDVNCTQLVADYFRRRKDGELPSHRHTSILWSMKVGMFLAHIDAG